MKILIVDDIVKNIQLVASVLEEYDITFATSGEEALEIITTDNFDLILLDVMMPGIDGFETCLKIREIESYKEIPIIFITADTNAASVSRGFEIGGQDYVTKPFNSSELISRVKNQLLLRQSAKEKDMILLQQFKMAQMGEAFSMITHQLKQPLGAISSESVNLNIALSLGTLSDDKVEKCTASIEKHVQNLSHTMDEYKSFFKPKNNFVSANINDVIDKTHLLTHQMIIENSIDLSIEVENEYALFKTLVNELAQVLLVLFQNSIDAFDLKQNEKKISLKMSNDDNEIIISVEDNAGGIPENIIYDIFSLNFTTKGDDGSGIGLYMVKTIITEHLNGSIDVKNINDGALFTIKLPKLHK